ncbi:TIGR02206 family membrane protein [Paenibacillus sp. LHD-38]|uniref:YwaF family protein n=1 Tax=Paenibacillus sp. LHD-38 TaxID=3072143 RepID=UPI00280CDB3C|nr:TIGR02206 family membrane protein [Paenibacillus sp. LHD-38]MDQ8736822.1 TIGR02206 family membrane protein [Paenibacillus sp. LHD-38]
MAFEMFSAAHYAALAVFIAASVFIVIFRKQIRKPKLNQTMRYGLAILLLCSEISLQLSYVIEHRWGIGSLPFQLCSLMVLISALVLMKKHEGFYDLLFFLGSMGALQALLTPNLDEAFPHFRYFHFFIAHIGIIGSSLFIMAVERYRPTFRSVLRAMLWLHVLAIPAAITNSITGTTNFMFLAHKPGTASLLDILAPWPWYLLQLEVIAFVCFVLLYAAVKALDYWRGRLDGRTQMNKTEEEK